MSLLSSPKVRLALIVNGLYFISLFTPAAQPHRRPRLFPQTRESDNVPTAPTDFANRAAVFYSSNRLEVTLKNDMTLVRRSGRTLQLAPSFSTSLSPASEPDFVLLNFLRYDDKATCLGDCPLTIMADGVTVWTSYSHGDSPGWQRESVPRTSSKLEDGRVVETLAGESLSTKMSYKNFLNMIGARRVIIRLGPDWVELNNEQLEALRDMQRRLPLPPKDTDSD